MLSHAEVADRILCSAANVGQLVTSGKLRPHSTVSFRGSPITFYRTEDLDVLREQRVRRLESIAKKLSAQELSACFSARKAKS